MIWQAFFKEMEKRAFPVMSALFGGLTAMDAGNRVRENLAKSSLTHPDQRQVENQQIQSPYAYQFEDEKRLNSNVARPPLS